MMRHRNINNPLKHTQLIKAEDDEFISKVARTVEEACDLTAAGFEYVTGEYDNGGEIFRKPKYG